MPKKVLVVYYTQTGQLLDVVNSITSPLAGSSDISIVFEAIKPKPPFSFPWTSDEFFQAMPECVKGIPCELEPLSLSGQEDFDLIIIAWQPWFLSPSMPIHAFFQNSVARQLISGKPIITIIGSRNMWVMGQKVIKKYIHEANSRLVGNIVLFDRASNLLSVVSIIRWMFTGEKDRYMKIFPPAGISPSDIKGASLFGQLILDAIQNNNIENIRIKLVQAGGVDVQPALVMIEKRGIVFFRLWADFILKKGSHGAASRLCRVRLFKYYLLVVIYLASPFATILFYITKPFRSKAIKKQISFYQSC